MRTRYIAAAFVIFIAIIAVIGLMSNQNCSRIGSCSNCWSTSDAQLSSSLCPQPGVPCTAKPYLQQHNAVVDTLVCACASAKSAEYKDTGLNKQIEDAYFAMRGGCSDDLLAVPIETRERNGIFCVDVESLSAQELCESAGQYLAKRPYG